MTAEASQLERLIEEWRSRALVAGQFSVDAGDAPEIDRLSAAGEANALTRCADELAALVRSRGDYDGGIAETERRHSEDCRQQEAQRQREAEALQAGFELGKASGVRPGGEPQPETTTEEVMPSDPLHRMHMWPEPDGSVPCASAIAALRRLGSELNRGAIIPNLAEQIWDQCDILAKTARPGGVETPPVLPRQDWNAHVDAVRPAIQELDRRDVESMAAAPTIAVSNARGAVEPPAQEEPRQDELVIWRCDECGAVLLSPNAHQHQPVTRWIARRSSPPPATEPQT